MTEKEKAHVANVTPTWISLYPLFCERIDRGTKSQKDCVKSELKKLCESADKLNMYQENEKIS